MDLLSIYISSFAAACYMDGNHDTSYVKQQDSAKLGSYISSGLPVKDWYTVNPNSLGFSSTEVGTSEAKEFLYLGEECLQVKTLTYPDLLPIKVLSGSLSVQRSILKTEINATLDTFKPSAKREFLSRMVELEFLMFCTYSERMQVLSKIEKEAEVYSVLLRIAAQTEQNARRLLAKSLSPVASSKTTVTELDLSSLQIELADIKI